MFFFWGGDAVCVDCRDFFVCCPALTCWWSLKRARGAQGSEVDFKRGGRDGRVDDDITADPLTSDWLWRPVFSTPLARLRSSSSFLSSSRRRSRISVFSLRGGANSDVRVPPPPPPALLRNSSWEALRLNSVRLTDSSLLSVGSLTLRCRLPAQGIRELNKGSATFDWALMTLARAESDSLRRCIRGGVDTPPRPELLPLELLLFSSVGSSLLRVPATTTGAVAFQLVKNWAKSQSFSIYFRDGVPHIQHESGTVNTKRPWSGQDNQQKGGRGQTGGTGLSKRIFFLNGNPQKPRQNESRVDTGRTNQLKDGSPRHFQEPPKIPLGHVINFRSEFPCCVCRKILGKIPISIAEKWNVYNQREKKTTTTTTTRHSNANVK